MLIVEKPLQRYAVYQMLTRDQERILFNTLGMYFMVSLYPFYEYLPHVEMKSILTYQPINDEKVTGLMIGRL